MAVADKAIHARWLAPTIEQILPLFDLKENWNSYGAPPIDPGAIGFALAFLVNAMQVDTPRPAVVPSPSGGLQFEWHEQGVDLEVEALPGGRFAAYFGVPSTGAEEEI